jgi:osmotically inducible protein OsmC
MKALYSIKAHVKRGHVATNDGLLNLSLSLPQELGGQGDAPNPEHLFAAGFASCFENALRLLAKKGGISFSDVEVTATVRLYSNDDKGYKFGITLLVEFEGIIPEAAKTLIDAAGAFCAYSNAMRGNVDVKVNLKITKPPEFRTDKYLYS